MNTRSRSSWKIGLESGQVGPAGFGANVHISLGCELAHFSSSFKRYSLKFNKCQGKSVSYTYVVGSSGCCASQIFLAVVISIRPHADFLHSV